ncbi:ERCC4 domain-containing protein [Polaromonas sp.]|uniref:ERCC4 domain-containing protein n=1 Tax=Polaromonas sp. TaxID=1869339 RepID=UPI00352B4DD5
MEPQKLVIRVDNRESWSGLTQALQRFTSLDVHFEDLPVGDFLLSDDVVVERKAAADFVNSILDKRLFSQVQMMKAAYTRAIVMIEGDVFATRSGILPDALRGALSWLSVIEGVAVMTTKDPLDSASTLAIMTRHAQEGLGYEIALRGSKPKSLDVLSRFAVEGLPGCGPSTARKLLVHFGSVRAVYTASAEELLLVSGVGKKQASQIFEVLTFPFNS